MLLGGDEIGRTQGGNNNAYSQDNEISWYDWDKADRELLEFTRRLIALQHDHPVFRRRHWFQDRPIHGAEVTDIAWLSPDGTPMSDEQWDEGWSQALGIFLAGDDLGVDSRGQRITDDSFFLAFNASAEDVAFRLPNGNFARAWQVVVDTAQPTVEDGRQVAAEAQVIVVARSLVLLKRVR
jgi:isoamylase